MNTFRSYVTWTCTLPMGSRDWISAAAVRQLWCGGLVFHSLTPCLDGTQASDPSQQMPRPWSIRRHRLAAVRPSYSRNFVTSLQNNRWIKSATMQMFWISWAHASEVWKDQYKNWLIQLIQFQAFLKVILRNPFYEQPPISMQQVEFNEQRQKSKGSY